jgi:hypothetical protein
LASAACLSPCTDDASGDVDGRLCTTFQSFARGTFDSCTASAATTTAATAIIPQEKQQHARCRSRSIHRCLCQTAIGLSPSHDATYYKNSSITSSGCLDAIHAVDSDTNGNDVREWGRWFILSVIE